MNTVKRTIEISAEVDAALTRVAEAGDQSPSEIIESALAHFLNEAAEDADVAQRWADHLKERKMVPLAAVRASVSSWDMDSEVPAPKP